MNTNTKMNSIVKNRKIYMASSVIYTVVFSAILIFGGVTHAQTATGGPKMFASADEAASAFIAAAESFDESTLTAILGPGGSDLIHTGEPVADRKILSEFAALSREKMTLLNDRRNPNRVILQVGNEDWPSPIPIVKKAGKWYLDAAAGRQELLYRRIGRDELDAIQICRNYVKAQHNYALVKHNGAVVNQYAQRIISTPGKQDGLAWRDAEGKWVGPIGENVAKAIQQGYSEMATPFHGYYFKVLKGQGPAAPFGDMNYLVNGYMIGGFALLAYPSQYRVTGVKTFMVNNDGVVFEKDLGPDTLNIANGTEHFNPDKTWSPVLDEN